MAHANKLKTKTEIDCAFDEKSKMWGTNGLPVTMWLIYVSQIKNASHFSKYV